ncbi:MAG: hypothetical protein LBP95_01075 [Deltaproteobacteria bacterium]|nr:hypothetical protein [Deltaproteobacteria bacterium]
MHRTAKKYFDGLGLKKLPTIKTLHEEYAPRLEEKKAYREYRQTKSEMRELLSAKTNVDRLLNITDERPASSTERDL